MFQIIRFDSAGNITRKTDYTVAFYGIALSGVILTYCLTLEAVELELEALRQAGEDIEAEDIAKEITKAA